MVHYSKNVTEQIILTNIFSKREKATINLIINVRIISLKRQCSSLCEDCKLLSFSPTSVITSFRLIDSLLGKSSKVELLEANDH